MQTSDRVSIHDMPNIKSAEKALRQSQRRRVMNLRRKDSLRGAIKKFQKLVEEKNPGEAQAALTRVFKAADKTAKSGYIKKNKANRIKARSSKLLKKLS